MRAKLCSSAIGASIKQNYFLCGLDDASCIVNCCNIAITLNFLFSRSGTNWTNVRLRVERGRVPSVIFCRP